MEKQLEDLRAMREASKYRIVLAERIGVATLRYLHPRKSLTQRIKSIFR